jgi:hypothetical protein
MPTEPLDIAGLEREPRAARCNANAHSVTGWHRPSRRAWGR